MCTAIRTFAAGTSGAVTVDWVVLAASVVGLGVASVGAVRTGAGNLGEDVELALERARVAGATVARLDFDAIDGLPHWGWGWPTSGTYGGWTAIGATQRIEIVYSGLGGVVSPDGGNMLDLDASPGNLGIGRTLSDLTPGETYTLHFNAADMTGSNGIDVYFGGQRIGSADPNGTAMQSYSFEFTAGSGDGHEMLVIQGTGPEDNYGAFIHGIRVY